MRCSSWLVLFAVSAFACGGSTDVDLPGDNPGDNPGDAVEDLDSDGDGLTDQEEAELGTDASKADSDDDGLTDSEEVEEGTNPLAADTDADGLSDFDEIELGTDPTVEDSDADGLLDGEEVTLGTDPLLADSDGDSFDDGVEVTETSDPLNKFDWPAGMGWPDFSADAPTGARGYDVGDILENFTVTDANGDTLSLDQFSGMVRMLDYSAGWCGPCRAAAAGAEAEYQKLKGDGFMMMHIMVDGYTRGSGADSTFLTEWTNAYGLTFPVVSENSQNTRYYLQQAGLYRGGIPFFLLIDRDGSIDSAFTGQAASAAARAEAMVAENPAE